MAEETLVDALWAQRETQRIMTGWCIAYTADGRVCRSLRQWWIGNAVDWCVSPMRRRQPRPLTRQRSRPPDGRPRPGRPRGANQSPGREDRRTGRALRATRDAAPPPPLAPPTLRQERAALWRIAMLCKDALASPSLPPAWRPYFVQIARACREGVTREEAKRGHGT